MINVIHIPHDGHEFPPELLKSVCIPLDRFYSYHKTMSDLNVASLIPLDFLKRTIRFEQSRLLCDVERFLENEEMEELGMGFCYERAYDGTKIKDVDSALRENTKRYYEAHHQKLRSMVQQTDGDVCILDLHSFSELIVPERSLVQGRKMPDICLGRGDCFLVEKLRSLFEEKGFAVDVDYPYSGSMVPALDDWLLQKHKCYSVMVEVNKDVYLENKKTADEVSAVLSAYLSWIEEL